MTDAQPTGSAHLPPPLVYASGVFIGWLLDRRLPVPISLGPSTVRIVAATICLMVCIAIVLAAFVAFQNAQTTVLPGRPASALVTSGPYQITRNPMYVSFVAAYIGATLWLNTWWPAVILPFVLLAMDRLVIRSEERYLASVFPKEYADYRSRVRRWL
jgi:protein-S-isoprenylcysteine O-methyltransferase Ste14